MPGTTAEASALDAYYTATDDAKRLVGQNMLDKGIEKWERALKNVAQYISLEELDSCKREFDDFFSSWQDRRALSKDTDSDSSEIGDTEDSDVEDSDDSADVDYHAEYSKLARKPIMGPRRSATFSALKRRETLQAPRSSFNNTIVRSYTHRAEIGSTARASEETITRKPTTSSESMIVSEPPTSPIIHESNLTESPDSKDKTMRSSARLYHGGLMGKENDEWFDDLKSKSPWLRIWREKAVLANPAGQGRRSR
ncbi:hypothetical protein O1611_g6911 [Lasiodiplodia mahajangana]|uniref:Uncharacterized protein n=1 Tax=Lasiodiplodia mahajangana TaxID=1108764 RepID=A0ACC2JHP3_9PEZI|nr:hypothetical protein O1611_g6911 [Lasiodiplodia mahajangana]